MEDPSAKPDVETKGQLHAKSLAVANAQATGKSVKDASNSQITKKKHPLIIQIQIEN